MMHQFDHRAAQVILSDTALIRQGQPEESSLAQYQDPYYGPTPRYWIENVRVYSRSPNYYLGYRRVTAASNERTFVTTVFPNYAAGDSVFIIYIQEVQNTAILLSNLASFVFDYVSRQKIGGLNVSYFLVKQLPVIPPYTYTPALLDFIVPRVLELTYTAWDLQPFAQDVGYDGPPFIWDEDRRFLLRCELDALYFHLYQIARDDVDYIMETFPIVKRKDEAATKIVDEAGEVIEEGYYRTKETILAMYDDMAALPQVEVPHPKGGPSHADDAPLSPVTQSAGGRGAGGEGLPPYLVPDVSQYATWLDPAAADESVAHEN